MECNALACTVSKKFVVLGLFYTNIRDLKLTYLLFVCSFLCCLIFSPTDGQFFDVNSPTVCIVWYLESLFNKTTSRLENLGWGRMKWI
jgi:hypothetical protein